MTAKDAIKNGKTALGIEFGSTRIKAVLIDYSGTVLAVGIYDWENSFENGIWTFHLAEIYEGLRSCYHSLKQAVKEEYDITLRHIGSIGISAMMHGYMAFDKNGNLLAPFQTWRNTNTQAAADYLTECFNFNIPLRWTVAHLYQRILDKEEHTTHIDYVSTLAGFIHWQLTGKKVIGIGDASGMFPVDPLTNDYDKSMTDKFDALLQSCGLSYKLHDIFPSVLVAGKNAGYLTEEGCHLLDADGDLQAGIPFCPPEGDAGTGMTATNAVAPRTGNVSAGTSTFAMIVLERPLSKLHREIDMVATPTGAPCAMSHANNGTTDLNAWVQLFGEFASLMGYSVSTGELFTRLYTNSLQGDFDCGGILPYGYYSGENITMINEGRPILLRTATSSFNLANLMRAHLYTSLGAVKIGLDILRAEGVEVDRVMGHGGFFKTKGVGQRYLSAACHAPVTVMQTASEGGAWGIALLAAYLVNQRPQETLDAYLEQRIFALLDGETLTASEDEIRGFETFMAHYQAGLSVEKAAIAAINW